MRVTSWTGVTLLLGFTAFVDSEFAPVSYIPHELVEYFHPWVREEELILPGVVERRKRALEDDVTDTEGDTINPEYENDYTVSRKKSDPETGEESKELCMLIRLSASFTINFEAKPPSPVVVDSKSVDLPTRPDSVNGTCVMETEKAKISMFWSGYNFTLEFIKNPEGNSYYMNRALIQYNTKHPDLAKDFQYAALQGVITLQTMPGLNFFFTPLGKSFICRRAEDQGPLKLFRVSGGEMVMVGEMEMWNTKFQPFAGLLLLCSGIFFGSYAAKRTWFNDQKVDYGNYEEGNVKVQHEMEMVRQQQQAADSAQGYQEVSLSEPQAPPQVAGAQPGAANPFQQKSANPFQAASNPFNN